MLTVFLSSTLVPIQILDSVSHLIYSLVNSRKKDSPMKNTRCFIIRTLLYFWTSDRTIEPNWLLSSPDNGKDFLYINCSNHFECDSKTYMIFIVFLTSTPRYWLSKATRKVHPRFCIWFGAMLVSFNTWMTFIFSRQTQLKCKQMMPPKIRLLYMTQNGHLSRITPINSKGIFIIPLLLPIWWEDKGKNPIQCEWDASVLELPWSFTSFAIFSFDF